MPLEHTCPHGMARKATYLVALFTSFLASFFI